MCVLNDERYDVLEEKRLMDIQANGYLFRHKKSGAKIVFVQNEDENKTFFIGFRTPPIDNTGVTHILEHSLLCGSKKYPAKDPFVELAKGSLNTFLNAMTFPDRTLYPVASCNNQDFQNLVDVYLDAVFHPNIYEHEEIFMQEGWSYLLTDESQDIQLNGVVYNEMKGAYSSPETVLMQEIKKTLFPETAYQYESGGNPKDIPSLSYEQFINYHQKYYHPSNSYIYFYGNIDINEKLAWLDENYLTEFTSHDLDTAIHLQPAFQEMKDVVKEYAVGSQENCENNAFLSYSKVIKTTMDATLYQAFQVLQHVLLDTPDSYIKECLFKANIGMDVYGSFDGNYAQPIFSIQAVNANENQKETFVQVIEEALCDIVQKGIDSKSLLAAMNYFEFRFREADFGSIPKGLAYGMQIMESWTYDENQPFLLMEQLQIYDELRKKLNTGYFEQLIQTYLLDNQHGAVVTLRPDPSLNQKQEEKLKQDLINYKNSLNEEELYQLIQKTYQFITYQQTPSKQEDIEKIPLLKREDINQKVAPLHNEWIQMDGVSLLYHEIETSGIGYLKIMFDVSHIAEEDLPYVSLLQNILGMMDTQNYFYGDLYNEINLTTGGLESKLEVYPYATEKERAIPMFVVETKALYAQISTAILLAEEFMLRTKLEDVNRLFEIVSMSLAQQEQFLMMEGHSYAMKRSLSYHSPTYKFKDLTQGIGYYLFLSNLLNNFENDAESLICKLKTLSASIFRKENLMISYTASKEGLSVLECELSHFVRHLPIGKKVQPSDYHYVRQNEGFVIPSEVQYVAQSGNYLNEGFQYSGIMRILDVILEYDYLWQNIRVKGGAYGCMSKFDRYGHAFFVTYRDPNLQNTLDVFQNIGEFVKTFQCDERNMTKYIIGAINMLDQPLSAMLKGERSLQCYMSHVDEKLLQKERDEILNASASDIQKLYPLVEALLKDRNICVVGNENEIEMNKELFDSIISL